jgi:hypothetical protein
MGSLVFGAKTLSRAVAYLRILPGDPSLPENIQRSLPFLLRHMSQNRADNLVDVERKKSRAVIGRSRD